VIQLQAPADVDVFGHHVGGPEADPLQGRLSKRRDHPGDGEYPPVDALGAFDEADDRRELADLNFAQQGRAVADAWIAGDGRNPRAVDEVPHQPVQGMAIQHGVAVDADQNLVRVASAPMRSAIALPWLCSRCSTRRFG